METECTVVNFLICEHVVLEFDGKMGFCGVFHQNRICVSPAAEFPISIPKLCVFVSLRFKQCSGGYDLNVLDGDAKLVGYGESEISPEGFASSWIAFTPFFMHRCMDYSVQVLVKSKVVAEQKFSVVYREDGGAAIGGAIN